MSGPSPVPWLQLLRAAQAGNDAALTRLLELLFLRITARMLRDSGIRAQRAGGTAEDIAAMTSYRVACALDECRAQSDGQVLAWAYRIAANAARDYVELNGSRVFLDCVDAVLGDADATTPSLDEVSPVTQEELLLVRAVFAAYDRLPEPAAAVIWHRLTGQPSWAETAAELRTTESGARRRFQRALDSVRRAVSQIISAMHPAERKAVRRALSGRLGPRKRRSNP